MMKSQKMHFVDSTIARYIMIIYTRTHNLFAIAGCITFIRMNYDCQWF